MWKRDIKLKYTMSLKLKVGPDSHPSVTPFQKAIKHSVASHTATYPSLPFPSRGAAITQVEACKLPN